jgi:integrative and conjugative element protein (TIGR02256 family)
MDEKWTIEIKDLGLVRISDKLIEDLSSFRQLEPQIPESGGVLLGKHLNSNGIILIDGFTPPQPNDSQGRCRFHRSKQHSDLAEKAWRDSDGHLNFVGLWHTHPEPIPTPSGTDLKDWKNALRRSCFEGNHLFFFIVGQTHIGCWIGSKSIMTCGIKLAGEYEYGE